MQSGSRARPLLIPSLTDEALVCQQSEREAVYGLYSEKAEHVTSFTPTKLQETAKGVISGTAALNQSVCSLSERSHILLENLQSAGRISRILLWPFFSYRDLIKVHEINGKW